MTVEEFSDQFDTLVDSYRRFKDFDKKEELDSIEFNEYEKSVFLTKAQQQIVINLYNGKLLGDSIERTEELRRYLSDLTKTYKTSLKVNLDEGLSSNSVFFKLPDDVWFKTYESVELDDESSGCMNGKSLEVVPITQDEYHKTKDNPFRRPNKRRALRLDISGDCVEIISDYNVGQYMLRYLAKPTPIVLTNLQEDISIDGVSTKTECKLNPAIHYVILDLAVSLALQSKTPAGKL